VTISDDLQADGIDPISDLATKSSAAGLDIALYAKTERAAARAFAQLERAVRAGRLSEEQIRASAARIRALKERLAR
jgi:beta-glucosidase-like glycosyl hydrolase